jgi:beta-phosphoglucomutase-like phosphatase (HAD superfamily)
VTGEDIAAKKPAPDIFLKAASELEQPADACVVVEDAINGVRAAKAAGMRCIAVAHTFAVHLLSAADLVRERISEVSLQDLLGSGNGRS